MFVADYIIVRDGSSVVRLHWNSVVWSGRFSVPARTREKRNPNLLNYLIERLGSGRDNSQSYFYGRIIFKSLVHKSVLYLMGLVRA